MPEKPRGVPGHHIVRMHLMNLDTRALHLPSGEKPVSFMVREPGFLSPAAWVIMTREWVRDEKANEA